MESLESRARAVRITFWLLIVVYAGAALSDLELASFLSDLKDGASPDEAYAEALDDRQSTFGTVQVVSLLACAIAFCSWFAQAHRNLGAAGVQNLRYSPGWAVGGFFVPLLNLVRPHQVMQEVWTGSMSLARNPQADWRQIQPPPIVGWWWGLFLVSAFLDHSSGRLMMEAKEIDGLLTSAYLTAFADVFNLPAAYVALRLVGKLTVLQQGTLQTDTEWGLPGCY